MTEEYKTDLLNRLCYFKEKLLEEPEGKENMFITMFLYTLSEAVQALVLAQKTELD